MAEAAARSSVGDRWEIWSAGSFPSGRVHPLAIQLMAEQGVDLSRHASKGLEALPQRVWDYVVTMGCGDQCPALPAGRRIDWQIPDPVAMPLEQARQVRDRIIHLVRELLRDSG